MSMTSVLLFLAPGLSFRRSASRVLGRVLPPEEVSRLLRESARWRSEARNERPRHSFGVDLLIRYFEWDLGLYRAALRAKVPPDVARGWIEEVKWDIFGPVTAALFAVSRVRSGRLRTRFRWMLDRMFQIVFTRPFERTVLPSAHGVAFDVTVCPLAQYFRDRGVPELTDVAACRFDHRLAAQCGVRFERTTTIAAGHPRCDFRFETDDGVSG